MADRRILESDLATPQVDTSGYVEHAPLMATTITEWFGYRPEDTSAPALQHAADKSCPFLEAPCTKTFSDGTTSGVCTLKPTTSSPVICCPNRLYGREDGMLRRVALQAFGPNFELVPGRDARAHAATIQRDVIGVFGGSWGSEIRVSNNSGGGYYVDFILAKVSPSQELVEFVAVEVQTIDTTGNYRNGFNALRTGRDGSIRNSAGFNWENVNKRILPQIIFKSHLISQEDRCLSGLFFVTPQPVYEKIMQRLTGSGTPLREHPMRSNSITFLSYDINASNPSPGVPLPLNGPITQLTTTTAQVEAAFTSVSNLPAAGSYATAIEAALH